MEISEIKSRLTLSELIRYYGIKADKKNRICCPFHDDKTPSMQLYWKTHTAYCFSSNCTTHGKSMDVIDFIMRMEKCTKHEALKKATAMITGTAPQTNATENLTKTAILTKMFIYFKNAVHNSPPAREYIKVRTLDYTKLEIGYNSGQFHHGTRKEEALIQSCLQVGLLQDKGLTSRTGEKAYVPFAKFCIAFALKNKAGQISGMYFRSTVNDTDKKHFFLENRQGLYPGYPKIETEKLIITEAIIDAATLLQLSDITSQYSVLAAYGTNGITEEHFAAIKELPDLREVIFAFDADDAGRAGTIKYAAVLKEMLPSIIITTLQLPMKDINEVAQGHSPEIFTHLLNKRVPVVLEKAIIFSEETKGSRIPLEINTSAQKKTESSEPPVKPVQTEQPKLNTKNPEQLIYDTEALTITVWGGIEQENLSRLKVSLHVQLKANRYRSFRDDVNLYSHTGTQKLIRSIAETLELSTSLMSNTIADLIEGLEKYRLQEREQQLKALVPQAYEMTPQEKQAAQAFITEPNLVQRTLDTLSKTGLIGETKNGLLLYFLYLSRFFDEPLHAIIFGKSGSGKTYLQTKISECLPEESVRTTTSLSENTLYYSPKNFWKHIVLLIEDLDGVYNALLPLREFMSKQSITKLTTDKDAKGNNVQKVLTVEGPICVSGATTKENIYEDNANRSFLIYVDESSDHLNTVMEYQRKEKAGLVNKTQQQQAKQELRNAQRLLEKNIKIINPYAVHLRIPDNVFKKLRTNMHYLKLIEIITFYHQAQRPIYKNKEGERCMSSTLEDIYWANYLVKDVLLKKSDELNGALREFFEDLKTLVGKGNKERKSFYAKEVREHYRMNPMRVNRYLNDLEMRSYLHRTGGNRKTGFEYEITNWQEYETLKDGINILDKILDEIKVKEKQEAVKYNNKKVQASEV